MENNHLRDEIDFKELLKNPMRLFGWIYPFLLILIVIAGIFYVKNLDEISYNNIKPAVEQIIIPQIEMKKGGILPAVDLSIVKNAPRELITEGKELYENNCASCHGIKGLGDGTAGAALNPLPRNFTDKEGWTNTRDMFGMYKTLQEGIIKNGMAAYEYIISEERIAILHYIRTLADFSEITDMQVEELDLTFGVSNEISTANQIPVSLAKNKLQSEYQLIMKKVEYLLETKNFERAGGIQVYLYDIRKIFTVFVSFPEISNFNNFETIVMNNPLAIGFNTKIVRVDEIRLKAIHNKLLETISR